MSLAEFESQGQGAYLDTFRAWFGGSKVVDAHGKPLVVYHGTDRDIDTFALQNDGQSDGFFFAGPESTRYVEYYVNQKEIIRGAPGEFLKLG